MHTPGPWVWGEDYCGLFGRGEISDDNAVLAHADYEGMWVRDYAEHGKADAALIAAAPDLLAIVKALHPAAVDFATEPHYRGPDWDVVKAAISKAEGKSK